MQDIVEGGAVKPPIGNALALVILLAMTSLEAEPQRGAAGRGRGQGVRQGARGQAPSLPRGTAVYRDVEYVTNGHALQKLDLYVPRSNSNVPLIVFIHGGGFSRGDKADQDPSPFLSDGYAFASLNYRLSGDAIFPAQIEDCKAAVRWLRANAARYKLDPERFGAWGTSAGGHLVAMLGTTGDATIFDVGENLEFSSRVQAVADWFGPTDFLQMDAHRLPDGMGHNGAGSPESRLIGGPIQQNKEKVARANPITYITPADPPFLIAHGDQDLLVPHHQSELLHAALTAARVPSTFLTIKGAGHGLRNAEADKKRKEFFEKHVKRAASR
jgi:acetyl esterase/lipase